MYQIYAKKNRTNEVINKTTEDVGKILAVKKLKELKRYAKKHFAKLQKMKNTQSEIKPIKTGKRPGTTSCFGCNYFTHNFRPQDVKGQIKCSEKNQAVLFVSQISQDF